MRLKKSIINSSVAIISYIMTFLPMFILRRVFMNELGSELMGLSSLFENIIGYLSIAEIGIGTAIIFSLYEPFAKGNYEKIKGYLNYYKRCYLLIGAIILTIGILLTPILKYLINDNINFNNVKIYFILFLINTFLSYLFSYKQCILNVAQEGYKISICTTISKLLIAIFQIIVIKRFRSFYLYIIIQIIVNLAYYIILNVYIDRKYNFLKKIEGKLQYHEKLSLIRNVKALFLHKIGSVLVFGTDNIILSSFINLASVAKYTNYSLIINVFNSIIGNALNAITPSIGNLLVENDNEKAFQVHKKLMFLNFWIASVIVISLYNTITQFIALWLGDGNVLDNFTIGIVLLNLYFQMMRGSISRFKDGAGEYYKDRFAPIIEGVINLVCSLIFVNLIGMPGVFLGTFISNISVIFWTQPIIVYKYVFGINVKQYYNSYFKYLFIGIFSLIITNFMCNNVKTMFSIKYFIINCLLNVIVINVIYILIFRKNDEFLYYKNLIYKILKRETHRN